MPLILSGNVASATADADVVTNSCRFNNDDSPYMHKTPAGAGNRRTFTISVWFKTSTVAGGNSYILSTGDYDGGEGFFQIKLSNAGRLTIDDYDTSGSSYNLRWVTPSTHLIRDPSAWYHLVVAVDSTQAVQANRAKVYLNGTNISSDFTQTTSPSQNDDFHVNLDQIVQIGRSQNNDAYFDGYLAEFCVIDGSQLAATSFGEFDEDSPTIWKPIDVSGLTFGTNGFYLDFEASDNLGNDANGGTDLTEVNLAATDQATDIPTNNFCTVNPNHFGTEIGTVTMSEGNTIFSAAGTGSSSDTFRSSTMAVSTGKWYAEFKLTGTATASGVGINSGNQVAYIGSNSYDYIFGFSGIVYNNDSDAGGSFAAPATNDIIGVAVDLDNNKIYWSENGSFLNSGDPTSGATGTGAISVTASSSNGTGFYHFAVGDAGSGTVTFECNFGGSSGFTVSSGNADANGYGNFEYAPPSGYYALCTKNLAEFGG